MISVLVDTAIIPFSHFRVNTFFDIIIKRCSDCVVTHSLYRFCGLYHGDLTRLGHSERRWRIVAISRIRVRRAD